MKKIWIKISKKIKNLPKRIDREIETFLYKRDKFADWLHIMNIEESLNYIEKHPVSFYRYGDGEIALMMGEGIAFQQADARLARRLRKMLKPTLPGIKAAIPYYYFHYERGLLDFVEGFACAMKIQRRYLRAHCDKDYVYLDTSLSQLYQSYETYDFDDYFARVKRLSTGRKVTLICGEGIFKDLKYNLLEACETVDYLEGPSKNAFSEYDSILKRALAIPKDHLVCVVLGPTAKPLVYDLHKKGYQAWDIGHFIKDYDAYCKKTARDADAITAFYKPD